MGHSLKSTGNTEDAGERRTELRLDGSGRIRVGGDPVLAIVHRGALRHAPDRELGCTVRRVQREAWEATHQQRAAVNVCAL